MRLLYETMQGPRRCSERERQKLVVALAKAEVALQATRDTQRQAEGEVGALCMLAARWCCQAMRGGERRAGTEQTVASVTANLCVPPHPCCS